MIITGDQINNDLEESCQVLIIGSGAGGGCMAAELAQQGVDVIVLEEGPYYQTKDFSSNPAKMIPMLYRDAGTSLIMGSPSIIFSEGRCVGGSTVINGGMCWRTPEKVIKRWQLEFGLGEITPKVMEPFYEKVEKIISAEPQHPNSLSKGEMLWHKANRKMDYLIRRNRRNQKNCTGEGLCVFGCPTERKRSVLVTYIPMALKAGARLYTDCKAEKLIVKDGRAIGATVSVLNRATTKRKNKMTIHANLVIVACGAIQTPAFLLGSKVGNSYKQVGRNFLCHPNTKVVGLFDEEVRYWAGVHQAHQVHEFLDEGILFALGGVPPALVSLSFPCIGQRSLELMEQWNHMIVAGMLIDDTTYGRVYRLPWGAPLPMYQIDNVEHERLLRGTALLSELLFVAGAKKVLLPFFQLQELNSIDEIKKIYEFKIKKAEIELLTVHAFGTTRMAENPSLGVVNQWGEVHDTSRLFVVDGGIIPTSLGVNPQETIMALATRTSEYIMENKSKFLS
jgi:choline dehydrogenase-like flavoprotein